jgi:hypothetical protein
VLWNELRESPKGFNLNPSRTVEILRARLFINNSKSA